MKILGIETSCDDTAAAVVENGTTILSNVVTSQIDIHAEFGGFVPEVAARSHIEIMLPIVQKALKDANCDWDDVDAIAVTQGPGLIGSLLIGTLTAQTLAELKHKPLIPVNHIEAHTYANFLINPDLHFPLLSLTVSGGHTSLILYRGHGDYEVLGSTRDDAAGEAYDKFGRIIGLPFPGGPAIEKAAQLGDPSVYPLPKPNLGSESLDFSFSGLKTAALRVAQKAVGGDFRMPSYEIAPLLSDQQRNDLAASFDYRVTNILAERLAKAYARYSPASVVIGGGVAASKSLQRAVAEHVPIKVEFVPLKLCGDNAAMIASLGYYRREQVSTAPLTPNPVLSM